LDNKETAFPPALSNCAKNSSKQVLELSVGQPRLHVCSTEITDPKNNIKGGIPRPITPSSTLSGEWVAFAKHHGCGNIFGHEADIFSNVHAT
jgi:hypothetical protein